MTALYLGWARETAAWLSANPAAHDLFNSAVRTPHDLLDAHFGGGDVLQDGSKMGVAWGHPGLVAALSARYDIEDAGRVLVTAGASNAFVLVARALVRAGDAVVVETPVYEPFVTVLNDQGAALAFVARQAADGFALDVDALAAAVTPQTRLIVLTNLHNPSGALMDAETLAQVAAIAREAGAFVCVDEVYRDLAAGASVSAVSVAPDVCITIGSATKSYGLGALRAGWIITPGALVAALRQAHITYECSLSPYPQAMAARVFGDYYAAYRAHTDAVMAYNTAITFRALRKMERAGLIEGNIPPYGCVAFPRVVGVEDTAALAAWLRDEYGVVVAPGRFFRAPGHIRVGFGGDSTRLAGSLARLGDGLAAYSSGG